MLFDLRIWSLGLTNSSLVSEIMLADTYQLIPHQFGAYKRDVLLKKYMATKIRVIPPPETFFYHTLDGELFTTHPFSPNFCQQTLVMW